MADQVGPRFAPSEYKTHGQIIHQLLSLLYLRQANQFRKHSRQGFNLLLYLRMCLATKSPTP